MAVINKLAETKTVILISHRLQHMLKIVSADYVFMSMVSWKSYAEVMVRIMN